MLLGFVVMGFGIAVARLNIDWRKGCVALMCLAVPVILSPFVPGLGNRQYGALNWIQVSLGGFSVTAQPSEFVKPMLVICLAAMLGNHPGIKRAILALAFAAGLCGVLLIQSDLGALLIYFLTTVAMFYVATSRLGLSLAGLGAGAACAVIAYKTMPYVQRRLQSFLDPWSDPMETGYQIVQALIAIGSGGLFGMGLGLGMPRNIPLYHSDFIFAAICEEFGLIFAVCLLDRIRAHFHARADHRHERAHELSLAGGVWHRLHVRAASSDYRGGQHSPDSAHGRNAALGERGRQFHRGHDG